MNRAEFCRKLVSIDSSSSHGTSDIAAFVAEVAIGWGISCEVQSEEYNGIANANIILRNTKAPGKKELLLISKMDTLDPGDYAHWVRTGANPFNVSVDGGEMYGLGLSDAKADFACKLFALKACANKNYNNISPVVVGTFGNSSGAGAIRLVRKKMVNAAVAMVGAPTHLGIARKGPGYAKVEISIPYSPAEIAYNEKHNSLEASISQNKIFSRANSESRSDDSLENPISRMLDYLKNLPQSIAIISVDGGTSSETNPDSASLEIDIVDGFNNGALQKLVKAGEALKKLAAELKTVQDNDCEPNYSTISIGKIRTFPEEIKISGICRLVPSKDRTVYESWLERLRQECSNIGASFRILDFKPPFESAGDGTFFNILNDVAAALNLKTAVSSAHKCSEANIFQRLGIESVVFGPGEILRGAHASQERVRDADLELAEEFYKKVIERYCI